MDRLAVGGSINCTIQRQGMMMEWDFLIDRSQDGSRGGGMVERTGQSSRGGSCAWLSLAVWTFGGSPVYRAKKQPLSLFWAFRFAVVGMRWTMLRITALKRREGCDSNCARNQRSMHVLLLFCCGLSLGQESQISPLTSTQLPHDEDGGLTEA